MVRRFAAAAGVVAALAVGSAAGAGDPGVDLIGTWHVLIHYRDDNAHDPQAMRWDDKVWVFEPAGDRLRWTEYPIVVFRDSSGRFEKLGTSHQSRVVHAWEPNPGQLAQIRQGLEVNERGKKSKTLRGSDAEGWRSTSRARPASASIITYTEHWSIEGMPSRPVFQRADVMGSARTESLEGLTRYQATEVDPNGDWLRGRFERDGTRHGSFRMTRAGAVSGVKGTREEERKRKRGSAIEEWLR